jgi:SPP1 gp7 family putative phage head morphogenesis protein
MSQVVDLKGASAADMRRTFISARLPSSENYRQYYGKSVDMGRIENAIINADLGMMVDLCDIESESMAIDPMLSGLLIKRFGQIAMADWELTPAQGPDLDKKEAVRICNEVRSDLVAIPNFSDRLYDLGWASFDGRAALENHWAERHTIGWRSSVSGGASRPLHSTRWVPECLEWVHPRRLSFGPSRELRLIDTWAVRGNFVPQGLALRDYPGKFIEWCPRLFREYPEREGLGPRTLYWSFFKRFSWRMRMMLTELFGLPWRIVTFDKDAEVTPETRDQSRDAAENLGAETTAAFGQGAKLDVEFPGDNAGNLFQMTNNDVDDQMARLVLGNTATTKGDANRANGIVAKVEQDIVFALDGARESERIQHGLVAVMVQLNYGVDAMPYMPVFQIKTKPPRDRNADVERAKTLISIGLKVAEPEIRDIGGLRAPDPDEAYFVGDGSGGIVLVEATPEADASSDLEHGAPKGSVDGKVQAPSTTLAPADVASIISVNEGRASVGLGPLLLPDGAADPRGSWTVAKFNGGSGKPDAKPGQVGVAPPALGPANDAANDAEGKPNGAAPSENADVSAAGKTPPKPDVPAEKAQAAPQESSGLGDQQAAVDALRAFLNAGGRRPPFGSVEPLVKKGSREAARETARWAAQFVAAMPIDGDERALFRAAANIATTLDMGKVSRAVERQLVHGLMLGALDAGWEAENDAIVKPPAFRVSRDASGKQVVTLDEGDPGGADPPRDFATRPFDEAVRDFARRQVLPRPEFQRLSAEARRRAFTVAGLARDEMLSVVQAEITRALTDGDDLRRFRTRLTERFDDAGWTRLNSSHVELVFRNATMSAYSSGRIVQMKQPATLALRPFWQVLGVDDSRTRSSHRALHGKVFAANSGPRPPFGHNCRCRLVSRSARDVERLGLQVMGGAEVRGIPDEGWGDDGMLE